MGKSLESSRGKVRGLSRPTRLLPAASPASEQSTDIPKLGSVHSLLEWEKYPNSQETDTAPNTNPRVEERSPVSTTGKAS